MVVQRIAQNVKKGDLLKKQGWRQFYTNGICQTFYMSKILIFVHFFQLFLFHLKNQRWKQSQRLCQRPPAAFTNWSADLQTVGNDDDDDGNYDGDDADNCNGDDDDVQL